MAALTEREMESTIARMLLIGVTVSAVLVFCGAVLYLSKQSMSLPDYTHFKADYLPLNHLSMALNAESIIDAGLLLLIATPVARVVFCIIGFLRQRDWLYVAVSACVLGILMYCLIEGGRQWR